MMEIPPWKSSTFEPGPVTAGVSAMCICHLTVKIQFEPTGISNASYGVDGRETPTPEQRQGAFAELPGQPAAMEPIKTRARELY